MQTKCEDFAKQCACQLNDRRISMIQTLIVGIEDQESFTFKEMIAILRGFKNYSEVKPSDALKEKLIQCAQNYIDNETDIQASDAFQMLKFSRGVIEFGVGILRPLLIVCTRRRLCLTGVFDKEFDELCKDPNIRAILREPVFTEFPLDTPQISDNRIMKLWRHVGHMQTDPMTTPPLNVSRQTVPDVVEPGEGAGASEIEIASVQNGSGQPALDVVAALPVDPSETAREGVYQGNGSSVHGTVNNTHHHHHYGRDPPERNPERNPDPPERNPERNPDPTSSVMEMKNFFTRCGVVATLLYMTDPDQFFKLTAFSYRAPSSLNKAGVKYFREIFGGSNTDKNADHMAHPGSSSDKNGDHRTHWDVPGASANSSRGKTHHKSPSQSPDISKGAAEGERYDLEGFEIDPRGSSSYDDRPFNVSVETNPSKRHIPGWTRYSPLEERKNGSGPQRGFPRSGKHPFGYYPDYNTPGSSSDKNGSGPERGFPRSGKFPFRDFSDYNTPGSSSDKNGSGPGAASGANANTSSNTAEDKNDKKTEDIDEDEYVLEIVKTMYTYIQVGWKGIDTFTRAFTLGQQLEYIISAMGVFTGSAVVMCKHFSRGVAHVLPDPGAAMLEAARVVAQAGQQRAHRYKGNIGNK